MSESTAAKRVRDYALERERRNIRARAQGFSSLDALAKARRKGLFPTAKEIKTSPEKKREAERIARARVLEAEERKVGPKYRKLEKQIAEQEKVEKEAYAKTSPRTRQNAGARDKACIEWSAKHSRKSGTKFNPRWSAARKDLYWRAFVKDWDLANRERDFRPTYQYIDLYFPSDEIDGDLDTDPYSGE